MYSSNSRTYLGALSVFPNVCEGTLGMFFRREHIGTGQFYLFAMKDEQGCFSTAATTIASPCPRTYAVKLRTWDASCPT